MLKNKRTVEYVEAVVTGVVVMMKRILLVLTIGVSFAPAAYANPSIMDYRTCPPSTGQNSNCQLEDSQKDGSTQCSAQKALDSMVAENRALGLSDSGSAQVK